MTIKKFLNNFEEYFCVCGMAIMTVVVFSQVIMRYIFSFSLPWSEEFSRFVFIWISWVGASYAVKESRHFKVEIFANLLKGNARRCLDLFVLIVWFMFCFFLARYGTRLVLFLIDTRQISAAMEIPMSLPYAAVPVGAGLMCVRLIAEMWKVLKKEYNPDKNDKVIIGGGL